MDIQFYGANCVTLTYKGTRLVFDDNLAELGAKSIVKSDDIVVYTGQHGAPATSPRLTIDQPGEYEVSDISIEGVAAQAHMDEGDQKNATIYKVTAGDLLVLITGHIYPEIASRELEDLGLVDVLIIPVGGNGYTLDAVGALKVLKEIEPKLVIPTHYAEKGLNYPVPQQSLEQALKELAMEPKETTSKLKLKASELSDATQLVVLDRA
jgi:L-ascorbate metabolism protein UlaG (beta-lactamase superfamily)